MRKYAVLTASGSDRVGIVDEFTSRLLDHSCNIEESKMAVLGGEFAMIVLVSGDQQRIDGLLAGLTAGAFVEGLEVTGKETRAQTVKQDGRPYRIESVSLDTPGIVHAVTTLLRTRGINIDDLETATSGAPFTGAPMFHVVMTVIVPRDVSIGRLRRDLTDVGEDHDLDIRLVPIVAQAEE